MHAILTCIFCCAAFFVAAQSSPEKIDSTVQVYDAFVTEAEQEETPEILPKITTGCTLMKRAIGTVNHDITIYFDRADEIIESEKPSTSALNESYEAIIRKVSFTLTSGSYTIDFFYHFNSNGDLIRYQEKMVDSYYGCTLKTFYFNAGKCLKFTAKNFVSADCPEETESPQIERTKLTDEDVEMLKQVIDECQKFKTLLELTYKLMME